MMSRWLMQRWLMYDVKIPRGNASGGGGVMEDTDLKLGDCMM